MRAKLHNFEAKFLSIDQKVFWIGFLYGAICSAAGIVLAGVLSS